MSAGTSPVGRRYGKAIFALAVDANAIDATAAEIKQVADTIVASPDLATVLANPTIAPTVRKAVMNDILARMGVSPMVRNAVLLITDHGRAASLPQISDALALLADERAGRVRAEITSAAALTDAQYQRVTSALERMTGRRISLVRKVDPTLIGGVVTRVGDKVYDGSVRSRLAELRTSLLPS